MQVPCLRDAVRQGFLPGLYMSRSFALSQATQAEKSLKHLIEVFWEILFL